MIAMIAVVAVLCGSGGAIIALVVTVMCASKSLAYHNCTAKCKISISCMMIYFV